MRKRHHRQAVRLPFAPRQGQTAPPSPGRNRRRQPYKLRRRPAVQFLPRRQQAQGPLHAALPVPNRLAGAGRQTKRSPPITQHPADARLHVRLAKDPYESTNLADQHPDKVETLQARLEELAKISEKPLFMETAMGAVFAGIFGPAPIPTEENSATAEP
jgi:hypothetical protein